MRNDFNFDADLSRHGIFGHSMGGHGALTIGLKNPDIYRSISAFAPICNPINCPWGKKALRNYLGDDLYLSSFSLKGYLDFYLLLYP